MSVSAMEAQCVKTIIMHLVDKSDFILPDHVQNTLQIFTLIPVELAKSEDCIKFQSVVNTNLAKRLARYFASW